MLEFLSNFINAVYDVPALIAWGGYGILAAIIFAETGLMFGFFLPGDSLLVTAGLFAATGQLDLSLLILFLFPAAVLGDALGYLIGSKMGHALYSRPDSLFFRRSHLLKAKAFYEKHGGKTIIMARFVPVVRTFAPVVAGVAEMPYSKFAVYNITGAFLWVAGLTSAGFFLGRVIPNVESHLNVIIALVIILSFLPAVHEWHKERKK
jgi:membrane-associated protein